MTGCLCAASSVGAHWECNDILSLPSAVLNAAESNVLSLVADLKLQASLVDYGVVGSFAHGCARISGDDLSDLDIVVYLSTNAPHVQTWWIHPTNLALRTRYARAFQATMGFEADVGIHFWEERHLFPANPDFIFYSLKTRTMRGRPDGAPRRIKNFIMEDTFINVERDEYNQAVSNSIARFGVPAQKLFLSNDCLYFGYAPTTIVFYLPAVRLPQ